MEQKQMDKSVLKSRRGGGYAGVSAGKLRAGTTGR